MSDPVVGFVGLGNIGAHMAERLVDWPGGLVVHDLREEAMAPFVDKGAKAASSLAELAAACDVISVVVLTDQQARDVVSGILPHARPGTVVALHSTVETSTPVELAELAATSGVAVLDAPVSGGPMGAAQGRLAVMVGGDRQAYEQAKPVFSRWAELVLHLGAPGAGTQCKLARNLLTYAGFAAAAEASRLAEAAGIDLRKLAAVVRLSDSISGGPSAVMVRDTTAPMTEDDGLRPYFEHARELAEKDLALALALGRRLDVGLPFATLTLSTVAEGLGVPHEEK